MAGLNFIGSYSGIDKATIDKLMEAEKMPLVQLANKQTSITTKQNAWKDVNTRLNSLFEKMKALQNKSTFTAKASTSSNDKNVSMTVGNNAGTGTYKIKVDKLATSTSIIGGELPEDSLNAEGKLINNGKFTIKNHGGLQEVTIDVVGGTDSLKDIATKINEAKDVDGKGIGVTATIIDNRLVLTDDKTGSRDITLTENTAGTLTNLAIDVVTGTRPGVQAEFNINGIDVKSDSNKVTGVLEDVTINLTKTHDVSNSNDYDTVAISADNSEIIKAVEDFVEQFNSTMSFIDEKIAAGIPDVEGSRGDLAGDSGLMRLQTSLRKMVTDNVGSGEIKDISQLGVTTKDKFGKLYFDSSKLTKALSENADNVINFFSSKNADDKDIGFVAKINNQIDSFTSTKDGLIKGKNESYEKTLKNLNKQIDNFNARMVKKEAYYVKMFTALDVALMKAESQMSWLQGQVDSMNSFKK